MMIRSAHEVITQGIRPPYFALGLTNEISNGTIGGSDD